MKTCSKCHKLREEADFYKSGKPSGCLSSHCKLCKNAAVRLLRSQRSELDKPQLSEKQCNTCQTVLPIENFTRNSTTKDGYCLFCKACRRLIDKRQKLNRDAVVVTNSREKKECHKCRHVKSFAEFRINLKSSDNRSNICEQCTPKSQWTKEDQQRSELKYRLANPEKIREKYKKQGKRINRRVRCSLNHRISEALLAKCTRKSNKTSHYVGCSLEFLKAWIEYQFLPDMSWQNYGDWHIDHVVPCCKFDLSKEDEQLHCFNWTNLQPLWARDNLQKSGSLFPELVAEHKKKVSEFLISPAQVKEGELRESPKASCTNRGRRRTAGPS